jgi:hypothetical protein
LRQGYVRQLFRRVALLQVVTNSSRDILLAVGWSGYRLRSDIRRNGRFINWRRRHRNRLLVDRRLIHRLGSNVCRSRRLIDRQRRLVSWRLISRRGRFVDRLLINRFYIRQVFIDRLR